MSDLTVEDFKTLLLDLYLVQRENAQLRLQLGALDRPHEAPGEQEEEVTRGEQYGDRHP